jgi:glycosyltransferase involved in cell wall biosynthesis
MHIAILWQQEQGGGVDSHLLSLLRSWPNKEDNFTIIFNIGNGGYYRIEADLFPMSNVKSVQYRSYAYASLANEVNSVVVSKLIKYMGYLLLPITVNIIMKLKLKNILIDIGDVDAVIANNGGYPAAWDCFSMILAAKSLNIVKRVMLVHHAAEKANFLHGTYEHYMDLKMQSSLTDMVTVSFATRNSLMSNRWINTYKQPIRVIHNGITLNNIIDNDGAKVNIREKFDLHGKVVIGLVGRVERYKGHEDTIIACGELQKIYRKKLTVLFIGECSDQERKRLVSLSAVLGVSDCIIFTGYIEGDSFQIIEQLDLLLMITKNFEGFGLTLAEAMCVKTPIIATNVGAVSEFVDDSVGTIINPEAPLQLAEKLKEFMDNPDYFLNKTEKASELIKNKFNADIMAKQYRRVLIEPRME